MNLILFLNVFHTISLPNMLNSCGFSICWYLGKHQWGCTHAHLLPFPCLTCLQDICSRAGLMCIFQLLCTGFFLYEQIHGLCCCQRSGIKNLFSLIFNVGRCCYLGGWIRWKVWCNKSGTCIVVSKMFRLNSPWTWFPFDISYRVNIKDNLILIP